MKNYNLKAVREQLILDSYKFNDDATTRIAEFFEKELLWDFEAMHGENIYTQDAYLKEIINRKAKHLADKYLIPGITEYVSREQALETLQTLYDGFSDKWQATYLETFNKLAKAGDMAFAIEMAKNHANKEVIDLSNIQNTLDRIENDIDRDVPCYYRNTSNPLSPKFSALDSHAVVVAIVENMKKYHTLAYKPDKENSL